MARSPAAAGYRRTAFVQQAVGAHRSFRIRLAGQRHRDCSARPAIALVAHGALAGGRGGRPGIGLGAVRLQCTARACAGGDRHGDARRSGSRAPMRPRCASCSHPDASIATINTLLAHQGLTHRLRARALPAISPRSCRPMRSPRAPRRIRRRGDCEGSAMSLSRSRLHIDLTRHVWRLASPWRSPPRRWCCAARPRRRPRRC